MRHRLRSAICIAIATLAGIVAVGSGCSNQGEGERCTAFSSANNSINGTQDCQSGLICYPGGDFPTATGTYDRCCPPTGATVQACMMSNGFNTTPTSGRDSGFEDSATDATAAADAGEEDGTTADAKGEDATEGAADSSSD